jgi:hypothetical protein
MSCDHSPLTQLHTDNRKGLVIRFLLRSIRCLHAPALTANVEVFA